jgi:hypothetical protein
VKAVDAKLVLVHAYEVAAGVQLAVRVEESPRFTVLGDGVRVQLGGVESLSQNAVILLLHVQLMVK